MKKTYTTEAAKEKLPEVKIIIPSGGRHNEDIEGSYQRVIKDIRYARDRARIVVIIPAINSIPAQVVLSHWSLIFPPNQPSYRILAIGHEVGQAFSNTFQGVIEHPELGQWEYILTIEHDNVPPSDGVIQLVKSMIEHPEYAAIGGLYWTKGEGGMPQIWGDPKDPILNYRPQPPLLDQVQECNGLGMGFTLYRTKMFRDKKLRRPFFVTRAGKDGVGTQDLYFCEDAKKHGYRFAVDTRVKVGHFDPITEITW